MAKNKKVLQLKLIENLTNIETQEKEGKKIAALIKQINEMGAKNKLKKVKSSQPDPPIAA
jgi:hypothetical protein